MRALLATLLLAVIVGLTTADPLCCPDGCPDALASHGLEATVSPSGCVLCHGWAPAASLDPWIPIARVTLVDQWIVPAPVSLHRRRIEHPPRLA